MASALRKMTSVGADVRQIAALLQAKAPQGHMLAYITPKEAALLKAQGGSGEPDAETGIPSFQEDYAAGDLDSGPEIPYTVEQVGDLYPVGSDPNTYTADFAAPPPEISGFQPFTPVQPYTPLTVGGRDLQPQEFAGAADRLTVGPSAQDVSQFMDVGAGRSTEGAGGIGPSGVTPRGQEAAAPRPQRDSNDLLARLGLAGALGLIGAGTSRRAAEEGQAGRREIQALASPYQAKGQELQAAAQRGELTPTGQQAIQAARAQAAQGAERRGGVGAQQTEAQVQALRQQLLSQQFDYGLKLANIGDQMAMGAIRTGLQADQYVNQLNQSFYTNMAYIAAGSVPLFRSQ
jgi:hypothetical protein